MKTEFSDLHSVMKQNSEFKKIKVPRNYVAKSWRGERGTHIERSRDPQRIPLNSLAEC